MLIDLTRLTTHGMPVYPGDAPPKLTESVHFNEHQCVNHTFQGSMHVGTHMDGPMHMIENGRKLCDLDVNRFFGRGRLIDARGKLDLDTELLDGQDIAKGDIVLFLTGWDKRFGHDDYFLHFPTITPALAERLSSLGVSMIGLDSPSPDREPYPVHRILLATEILILENLVSLEKLLDVASFEVYALPNKWDADSAPARVVAKVL